MNKSKTMQQLHHERIERYLAEGRSVSGGTNSTTIITDLGTVITNISAAQQSRGAGGSPVSGVILDPTGMVNLLKLRAQEMKFILNYLLFGNMDAQTATQSGPGTPGQAGAVFLSGDSNASTTTTLLTNVYNDLA